MTSKLKLLPSDEEILTDRDNKRKALAKIRPLKTISRLPDIVGITEKTAKFLKIKSLVYLLTRDKEKIFLRYFFRKPFFYTTRLLRSYAKKTSFTRSGDLFFYGLRGEEEFLAEANKKTSKIIVGFSYCHKPFECPSGRFSDACKNDPDDPVCGQCFIGTCSTLAAHKDIELVYIPTIHHIGKKMFETVSRYPQSQVLFIITACELTLNMFGDWGNMVGAKGIGIRLDGRICNTMPAFELSEEGIKPGLTIVTEPTKDIFLRLLTRIRKGACAGTASE